MGSSRIFLMVFLITAGFIFLLSAISDSNQAFAEIYHNEKYQFSIEYPDGWTHEENFETQAGDSGIVSFVDELPDWTVEISISNWELDSEFLGMSDKEYLDGLIEYEKQLCEDATYELDDYSCSDFWLEYSTISMIDGRKAFQVQYTIKVNYSDETTDNITYFITEIVYGNLAWTIISSAYEDEFSQYLHIFDSAHRSFEFEYSENESLTSPPDSTNRFVNAIILIVAIVGGIGGSFLLRFRHKLTGNRENRFNQKSDVPHTFVREDEEIVKEEKHHDVKLLDTSIRRYILNFGQYWGFSSDNKIENEKGKVLGVYYADKADEYGVKEVYDERGDLLFSIDKKFSYTSFKEPHQIKMPDGKHVADVRRGGKWGYGSRMWLETKNSKLLHSQVPNDSRVTEITDNDGNRIARVSLEDDEFFEFLKGHPKSWVLHIETEYDRLFLLALFFTMIHQRYSTNLGGGG